MSRHPFLLFALALIVAWMVAVQAQPPPAVDETEEGTAVEEETGLSEGAEESADETMWEEWEEEAPASLFGLEWEQRLHLRILREDLEIRLREIRVQVLENELSPAAARARYRALMGAHRATLDQLLSPEQKELIEAARQQAERWSDGRPEGMASLTALLALNGEQRRLWFDLLRQHHVEVRSVRASGRYPDHQVLSRLRAQQFRFLAAVLTPEQRLKLDYFRQEWAANRAAADTVFGTIEPSALPPAAVEEKAAEPSATKIDTTEWPEEDSGYLEDGAPPTLVEEEIDSQAE